MCITGGFYLLFNKLNSNTKNIKNLNATRCTFLTVHFEWLKVTFFNHFFCGNDDA